MDLFLHYVSMPYLLKGIGFTISVTVLGLAGGLVVGLILASMQLSRMPVLAGLARAYTVIFRGTPLILQLVFVYDALPHIGMKLSAMSAAGLALAANEGPFIAEIVRAGVLGVDRGQVLAGQALGMTPVVLMRRVIAPQAIRTMVPAFGNEAVSAMKNSSLASIIAVEELTLRSTQLASSTFDFFSVFFASGLMYLVLTGAIALIQLSVEAALDLDRPASRRWERLMPWRRVPVAVPLAATLPDAFVIETVPEGDADDKMNKPGATASGAAGAMDDPEVGAADVATDGATAAHRANAIESRRGGRAARYDELATRQVAVHVNGLEKAYNGQTVLKGFDLSVRRGEVVALLGPSGSGKSTLLRCISHLERVDAGQIRIDGRRTGYRVDGRPMTQHEMANERAGTGVGMVFQHFNLFSHLTACENVAGPLRWVHGIAAAEAERRARALLARVGLSHRADALPRHLSGGQQQRVAIARALAPNPRVLLLDEPTSALDPELVGEVLDVIQRLALEDGLTMLISTHQLRFADEIADRVVFMSGGRVVEEGPAHDVLARPQHPLTRRFLNVMETGSGLASL